MKAAVVTFAILAVFDLIVYTLIYVCRYRRRWR